MKTKQNLDSVDIAKVFLALMVVAIHTPLLVKISGSRNLLKPWLDLAVPMFYLISFYLLSLRLRHEGTDEGKSRVRLKYYSRNAKLYFLWFIVLLPATLIVRRASWFGHGFERGITAFVNSLFFGSTFQGSYFLSASIIAVAVVSFIQIKFRAFYLIILAVVFYVFTMLAMDGYFIGHTTGLLPSIYAYVRSAFGDPYYNFIKAVPYVVIAQYISPPLKMQLCEGDSVRQRTHSLNRSCYKVAFVVVLSIAYYVEWRCFGHIGMTLAPLCVAILIWIKDMDISFCCAKYLRSYSIILYLSHLPFIYTINWFRNREYIKVDNNGVTVFVSAAVFGVLLTILFHHLERHTKLNWIRFMH